MDRALAKVVAVAALRSASELNGVVPLLKEQCDAKEYEEIRDAIADASLRISQSLLMKVFAKHPDLEVEIDAHYQRFGRPA